MWSEQLKNETNTLTLYGLPTVLSVKLINPPSKEPLNNGIYNAEILILSIASIQYLIVSGFNDIRRIQRWRYLDWILTTPLLLFTYWKLAETEGWTGNFYNLLIPNVLMILFGYLAEFPEVIGNSISKNYLYLLGMVSLLFVLYEIYNITKFLNEKNYNTKGIEYFFYIGWTLYGLNFINPDENSRQSFFNILDLFNKAIYSLYLDSVILDNLENVN